MAEQEQILREAINAIAENQKYSNYNINVKEISTEGANYTAVLYLVTVSESGKEDLNLFVKFTILNEKTRVELQFQGDDLERFVYTDLAKKYKAIEDEHNIPAEDRLIIPKYYDCDLISKDIMVFEDLNAKGFTTFDRFKSIDWPYASKAVETLAKFHALSISYRKEYSQNLYDLIYKCHGFYNFLVTATSDSNIVNAVEATYDENKGRLEKYLKNKATFDKYLSLYKSYNRPFFIHTDYRTSNLMHRVNKDGSIDIIPVDYQTIQTGSPVLDLLYFIFTGSDEEFRKQYYDQLVEHYYHELCRAMKNLQLDPEKIYSREDFEYDLKEFSAFGLYTSVCFLPLITVDPKDAPTLGNETNDLKNFLTLKINPLFRKKFNGIVNDYIRWGII
ncbi:ecdysteroid 22-kinase [Aphomia sociella]